MIRRLARATAHAGVRLVYLLRKLARGGGPPRSRGAHAICLTPDGRIVLVTLAYARGWRIPGGGLKAGESHEAAVLRELKEEIGLVSHGDVSEILAYRLEREAQGDSSALFLVRDVAFRSRWTLEVKAVRTFAPDELPDLPPVTRRLVSYVPDELAASLRLA